MTWRSSAVFVAYAAAVMLPANVVRNTWRGANPEFFNFALYDQTVTPDRMAPLDQTLYGSGVWAAGELSGPGWDPGGHEPPAIQVVGAANGDRGLNVLALTRTGVTLAGINGDMMYYSPAAGGAAGRGMAFHDFGGLVDVTNGELTIGWVYPPGTLIFGDPGGGTRP